MPQAKQTITAGELAELIGAELRGDAKLEITGAAPLQRAGQGDLAFLANPKYRGQLSETGAGAVILDREAAGDREGTVLVADNPYAAWARALEALFPEGEAEPGIHHTAIVGEGVEIHPDSRIDAHVVIGAGTRIGARAWIEGGTIIGEACTVGEDCRIGPNATLYADTVLGDRVRIHAGAVLGADGFGFAQEGEGYRKVPQVGRVVIEDDVAIGANTAVDRAAIEETRIGRGTQIDNLVQIGHNCRIGRYCVLSGQVGISGSTEVGDYCTMGGQVGIAGHISIPGGTVLSAKAGVIGEIREPGLYSGFPHRPHTEWQREQASLRQVRDLRSRLRALERALSDNGEGDS